MPSFQGLLQRWGFVKLRRYGLELTPDGRILSTRPVLDDGIGGRIVGWRDGDVAIWKLSSWKGERSEPSVAVDQAPPMAMPQSVAPPVQPAPDATPAIAMPSPPNPAPVRPSAAVMPVDVAAEPTVNEDDWEWTIALARARVAVEEVEAARPPEPPSRPLRAEPSGPRPGERPTPPPRAAARDSATSSEWPRTELIGAIDYDDVRVPTRPAMAVPRSAPPTVAIPRTTPSTVIPVPALPTMATMATQGYSRMEPVVRSAQVASAAESRFAKGTGLVDSPATRSPAVIVEDTIPNLSVGDRTRPGVAMPPATRRAAEAARFSIGDRTKPGIALPPAARAVELPSIRRRMSPR